MRQICGKKIYEKGCETNKRNKWKQIYETNMSWLLVNLGEKNWDPPYVHNYTCGNKKQTTPYHFL